jgi:hypothetical protein
MCNGEFSSIFSKGKFQQFLPPTHKPFPGPVAVGNNLVMRDIMISANDEGLTFSKSMEVLKNEAYGMSTLVGPKVLRTVSNVGSIISNDYAVQVELSLKLAKQVCPYSFTPMTVAASCAHPNPNPNHLIIGKSFLEAG